MNTMLHLLRLAIDLYLLVLVIRAVLSWVHVDPRHPLVALVHRLTEPVLAPIRARLGATGAVDFSPMVAVLILVVLERLVLRVAGALL